MKIISESSDHYFESHSLLFDIAYFLERGGGRSLEWTHTQKKKLQQPLGFVTCTSTLIHFWWCLQEGNVSYFAIRARNGILFIIIIFLFYFFSCFSFFHWYLCCWDDNCNGQSWSDYGYLLPLLLVPLFLFRCGFTERFQGKSIHTSLSPSIIRNSKWFFLGKDKDLFRVEFFRWLKNE